MLHNEMQDPLYSLFYYIPHMKVTAGYHSCSFSLEREQCPDCILQRFREILPHNTGLELQRIWEYTLV